MKYLILLSFILFISEAMAHRASRRPRLRTEVFHFQGQRSSISYELDQGRSIYQSDIIIDREKMRRKLQVLENGSSGIHLGGGVGQSSSGLAAVMGNELWSGANVYYEIDDDLPSPGRVLQAIRHWEDNTPLRFYRRTNQEDFIRFVPHESRCASHVGREGGEQEILLAPGCNRGTVIHEIGHAIGLFHEQSREDRDHHVVIHWDNIESGASHNFKKYSQDDFLFWGSRNGQDIGPYNFASIMHYGSNFFAKDPSQPTITRRHGCSGGDCLIVPNRSQLSAQDIMYIHELYCPLVNWSADRCSNYYPTGNSFTYQITARGLSSSSSEKCLDVAGGSRQNQAKLNRFNCHHGDNQLFYVDRRADGYFTIRSKHSGLCLDIPGSSRGYVRVQQYACHGGDNQKWTLYYTGRNRDGRHGQFRVKAKSGGKCLGFNHRDQLVTTDCTSSQSRIFNFKVKETPNLWFRLKNDFSNGCLDVPFNSSARVALQTHPCHVHENQKWRFLPRAQGTFAIQGKKSRKCVGVSNGRMEQMDCGAINSSASNKSFYFYLNGDGQMQIRTLSFPRKCVKYTGPGRLHTAVCGAERSLKWSLE